MLWVMVLAVFVFAFFGRPVWYWLIAERILLLPLIAGLAYELIRFAGKHQGNRVLMTVLAPGMWLQRLTTRQPSLDQLERLFSLVRVQPQDEIRLNVGDVLHDHVHVGRDLLHLVEPLDTLRADISDVAHGIKHRLVIAGDRA